MAEEERAREKEDSALAGSLPQRKAEESIISLNSSRIQPAAYKFPPELIKASVFGLL